MIKEQPDAWTRALVVFWDPEGARWEWALKPGFRHVFCCVDDGKQWLMFDARDGRPVLKSIGVVSDFDLYGFYENEPGMTVVQVGEKGPPVRVPFVLSNCVGLVKAMLCIRAPFVQTPHQLYRHLKHVPSRTPRLRRITSARASPSGATD
jgi:hypothetical protein